MKLFLFPILALLSQQAVGLVIYDFTGRCDSAAPSDIPGSNIGPGGVDCSGTATGVLSLADTYTPGTGLTTPDFISFFYSSTAGSFLATTLTNALHGILPAITGPSIEWVEIDFPSSQTGLNAIPNGGWRMEFISAGIRDNSGSAHAWTLRNSETIPEPTTLGLMFLGLMFLGLAGLGYSQKRTLKQHRSI